MFFGREFMGNFMGGLVGGRYQTRLRCYSAPYYQRADAKKIQEINYGGKILLPNSALDALIRLNIEYPMMFKLMSLDPAFQRTTHAGVLEFSAEEGKAYLPKWMMEQLKLDEGDMCLIEYTRLPSATYAKFKPQSTEFLNISNPKAVLEVELRKFACLTKGDIISVDYNDQVMDFKVMDLKPANAVTIIECDMNVEFDAPEGYVEPTYKPAQTEMATAPVVQPKIKKDETFGGSGVRLDGKVSKSRTVSTSSAGPSRDSVEKAPEPEEQIAEVIPDESYRPGQLDFIRYAYKNRELLEKEIREKKREKVVPFGGNRLGGHTVNHFKAFEGSAQTLRGNR
ncbi:unnamed protein product [Bursaphelenchus xylophilus]|uniref:(pine wood nematode) hypothetical protein n=1 Tax=Bursaphelenchus xylophilus TaxID=6326 RepID=A0A7I8WSC6_BURXY|nr:unnamed protein product [Bursaphelenchus xylophilus]CAG9115291.1 unnamed protein product [Bursaphelenchus xylophilus]